MLIVLLIGVLSCRIDKAGSYEMKVFNEIFDNLVEEMGALSSFEIPPPIPFLDNNNPIAYDTVGYDKKIVEIERKNRKIGKRDMGYTFPFIKKNEIEFIRNKS